jgi:hypothetical protein
MDPTGSKLDADEEKEINREINVLILDPTRFVQKAE